MPSGTGLSHFAKAHPNRYFDVGIAEEHAALFACGLATQGMTPFLTIYSTFFQRAYDMAIHDMAIQKLNVRLCMDRAGLSGDDGPTHHGLFDIGYLRHIPNWVHMQPKDEDEFVDMLWTMAHYNSGPIAVRYPRGPGTGAQIKSEPKLLEIGKAEVVQHGREVAIFGLGNMFEVAEEAARKLEEKGISVALINPRWIKPMDTGTLEFFAQKCGRGLHDRRSRFVQRFRLRGDGTSALADDQYTCGADRLARSIYRTRRRPNPAEEARHHSRRTGGKSASAPSQKIQAHAICGLKLFRQGWCYRANRKAKGAFVSESALHSFDGDKPNSVGPAFATKCWAMIIHLIRPARGTNARSNSQPARDATIPEDFIGPAALPLFCLAPHGVFRASRIAPRAVSSYLAFSPLPDE